MGHLHSKHADFSGLSRNPIFDNRPGYWKSEFADRLLAVCHDAIVSDYRLGGWTGIETLQLVGEHNLDFPFILVTGALGEEVTVECEVLRIADGGLYLPKDRQFISA